ncbi:hypothetical protein K3152_08710 [Qipengyuania sp. 1NDH17]|uniref:Uncharacterized protein n=1 Tax=Qipengyuania polymorpha TaxID=2867234 RepID=A0ABS7IZ37_9SPHN|nr:hypothetical protein [Qipengyuania polymorpha]MBX7458324.1 hypothetical protein [Qipengyuania polymorpha]
MPDLTTTLLIITAATGIIAALASVASVIIQHRRTPKLPEPPITPICITVLGVDMSGNIRDLPSYSCPPA